MKLSSDNKSHRGEHRNWVWVWFCFFFINPTYALNLRHLRSQAQHNILLRHSFLKIILKPLSIECRFLRLLCCHCDVFPFFYYLLPNVHNSLLLFLPYFGSFNFASKLCFYPSIASNHNIMSKILLFSAPLRRRSEILGKTAKALKSNDYAGGRP